MAPATAGSAFEAALAAPFEARTRLTLRRRGGEIQLVDGGGHVVESGAAGAAGAVAVTGTTGNDTLRIDFGGGDPAPAGVTFDGGDDSGGRGDELVIAGGRFETVTYDFLPDAPDGSHRGTIRLDLGGDAPATEIAYDGLEPLSNTGDSVDTIFNIPAGDGDNQAVLEDHPTAGKSQLRSANGSFETADFDHPTNSLTINLGNDATESIAVQPLEAGFTAPIWINGGTGVNRLAFGDGVDLNGGSFDGAGGTDALDYAAYTSSVAANLGLSVTGLSAELGGDQEVPAQDSTATGTAALTSYNPVAKAVNIAVTVDGIDPADVNGFHIHSAAPGVNGPIIVDLTPVGTFTPAGNGFTFTAAGVPLPAAHEAAFLGGQTYVNVHTNAAPNGEIRGQVFSTGNVGLDSGFATGTGGVQGVENVTGGSGADSLVGSFGVNALTGGGGADVLVGAPGGDALQGGTGNDALVWSNGDGSDVMDGQGDTDRVQVNGSLGATGDEFGVLARPGGRVELNRTNFGGFTLDIGSAESLTVNGIGGDDLVSVTDLTGVADLSEVGVHGLAGADRVNLAPAVAGLSVDMRGGDGSDVVAGPAGAATWSLDGQGQGMLAAAGATFERVERLLGGGGDDTFSFAPGAGVTGAVNGGAGTNALDYGARTDPLVANLGLGVTSLSAELGGDQEVPAQGTAATGVATFANYDPAAKTFDVAVTVNGIAPGDVSGFHIHRAAPGVNGPIIVDFGAGGLVPAPGGFTFNATGVALPGAHEAAFLGGQTYVNVHTAAAPNGLIRGQVFSNGNVNLANGFATATGGVQNIQSLTGGSAADSIVGSFAVNTLSGGGGADAVVGGPGSDTMAGGAGGDALVWSNGDGSDVMDGQGDTDRVQVNGSLAGNDLFTVGAGPGGRVDFDRISPGPFSLDVGTAENVTVSGIGGDDIFTVMPSAAAAVDAFGGPGSDRLGFDGGCLPVATTPGSLTAGGMQPVNHTTVEAVDVASAIRLGASSLVLGEGAGAATLDVVRDPSGTGPADIDFATSDGSAVSGLDFTALGGLLDFGAGDLTRSISVPIVGDGAPEPDETFRVDLSNAGPFAHVCSPSSADVTIRDDDGPAAQTPPAGTPSAGTPPAGTPPAAGRLRVLRTTIGRDGSATLLLDVPGPGTVTGSAVATVPRASQRRRRTRRVVAARGRVRATRAGRVRLKLRPTRSGKSLLRKRRRLRTTANLTFRPAQGASLTSRRTLTLKLQPRRRRR